ncbi:hypothetical protein, partial [Flavobacterium rhizosphaerae]
MKKTLLVITLLFFKICFSQTFLNPVQANSFGSNHHTNRDQTFFSNDDNNGNKIITCITERDSTFNDVYIVKLDENLEEVWNKRLSGNTKLSYDVPVSTLIDNNNNIYCTYKSFDNNYDYKIIVTKLDSQGNLLWENNYGFAKFDGAGLDSDGNLHLAYNTYPQWHFMTISATGEIITDYLVNTLINYTNPDIMGLWYKTYFINNKFYIVHQRKNYQNVSTGTYEQFIFIIDNENLVTYSLSSYINNNEGLYFYLGNFHVDTQNNIYLAYTLSVSKKIQVIKLEGEGTLHYSLQTPANLDSSLVSSNIDANGNFYIASNSRTSGSAETEMLTLMKFSNDGDLINNVNYPSYTIDGAKIYEDGIR